MDERVVKPKELREIQRNINRILQKQQSMQESLNKTIFQASCCSQHKTREQIITQFGLKKAVHAVQNLEQMIFLAQDKLDILIEAGDDQDYLQKKKDELDEHFDKLVNATINCLRTHFNSAQTYH